MHSARRVITMIRREVGGNMLMTVQRMEWTRLALSILKAELHKGRME